MVHDLDGSLVRIMRHGLHLGKILYFALIDLIRLVSAPAVDEDLPDITVHEAVHIEVRRDIEGIQFADLSHVLILDAIRIEKDHGIFVLVAFRCLDGRNHLIEEADGSGLRDLCLEIAGCIIAGVGDGSQQEKNDLRDQDNAGDAVLPSTGLSGAFSLFILSCRTCGTSQSKIIVHQICEEDIGKSLCISRQRLDRIKRGHDEDEVRCQREEDN